MMMLDRPYMLGRVTPKIWKPLSRGARNSGTKVMNSAPTMEPDREAMPPMMEICTTLKLMLK